MVINECLVQLTLKDKRLRNEINLIMEFVKEVSFLLKIMLIRRFLQVSISSKMQRIL